MDPNSDGEVTIEEFIAWHHRNHPTEPKHLYAQLLHLFNEIDVAHKDALNKNDISCVMCVKKSMKYVHMWTIVCIG